MFGTLIVVLPSTHKGGALSVRHAGRERVLDLSETAPSEVRWAAFYADCEHEVAKIQSGYRICLVYNLLRKAKPKAQSRLDESVPDHRPAAVELSRAFDRWRKRYGKDGVPDKLVYLLDHYYTAAGLAFAGLKDRDDAIARAFVAAAQASECAIHLAMVHIEESGWAEYHGGYHGYGRRQRRRYWEDVDEDDGDFEVGEVCDYHYSVNEWIEPTDCAGNFGTVPLTGEELLPTGALDDAEPDNIQFSEATGNEGASFERTYKRAAIVIWPEEAANKICLSAGLVASGARLAKLGEGVADGRVTHAQFAGFARMLCASWATQSGVYSYRLPKVEIAKPIRIVTAHGDAKLLADCLNEFLPKHYGKGEHNDAIAQALVALNPKDAGALLSSVLKEAGRRHCAACLDLWQRTLSLTTTQTAPKWLLSGLDTMIELLPKATGAKESEPRTRWSSYYRRRVTVSLDEDNGEKENAPPKLTPDMIVGLLIAIRERCPARYARQCMEAICANTSGFPPDKLLVPALTDLVKREFPKKETRLLWEHCARFLARRSARPPAAPKDWKQSVNWKCTCTDCAVLKRFAINPAEQILRLSLAKARRQHVHNIIDEHELDMTHVTERQGRPYTLVCTKTRTVYDKKCQRHAADVALMKRLENMATSTNSVTTKEALEKLRKAILAAK